MGNINAVEISKNAPKFRHKNYQESIKMIKNRQSVKKILDKLRYIKAVKCEQINYKYWFKKLILVGQI
jgi:hypothetical protein